MHAALEWGISSLIGIHNLIYQELKRKPLVQLLLSFRKLLFISLDWNDEAHSTENIYGFELEMQIGNSRVPYNPP